jgi:arylsulfatase A-like enzyme/Tfp pilus assembly protein PilF
MFHLRIPKLILLLFTLLLIASVTLTLFFSRVGLSASQIQHIILVSIDTCRADYLGCYGYPENITPNIDSVANNGILFENVISPVPITLPAHCSMLSGTIPPYHGVHNNVKYKLDQSSLTLAEILKDKGFATGAIISSFVLDSQFGLDQGFDTYNDTFEKVRISAFGNERVGGETSRLALNWLQQHKDDNFFLFLHYYDPHTKYEPPEPFATKFEDRPYTGEIAYTDYCIGQVIAKLKQLNLYDSSLIIITGDHGEMLGEHGEKEHTFFIYESALKVPLIFKPPGKDKGRRISGLAGLVDIVPTICGLMNIAVPDSMHGVDLSAYFRNPNVSFPERYLYCESVTPRRFLANSLLGVRGEQYKYIETTRPELYDIVKDTDEKNNLIEQQPQQARILQGRLKQTLEVSIRRDSSSNPQNLDARSLARLESLGYISSGEQEDFLAYDKKLPDPKDIIDSHTELQESIHLNFEGSFSQAANILGRLVREHPDIYSVRLQAALAAAALGDLNSAVKHNLKAAELEPGESRPLANLGLIMLRQNKIDDAIRYSKDALEIDSGNSLARDNLATGLARKGDLEAAASNYLISLEYDAGNPETHFKLAGVFSMQNKQQQAADHYLKVLALNPSHIKARSLLAVTLMQQEKFTEAIEHCKISLRANPNQSLALNNWAWLIATNSNTLPQQRIEAIAFAQHACELSAFANVSHLDTLAVCFAANDRFAEAIKTAEKAVRLASGSGDIKLAEEIGERLELYKKAESYFE